MGKSPKKPENKKRVAFRPNRNSRARIKDWRQKTEEGRQDQDAALVETVQAKGDLSRHRTVRFDGDSDEPGDIPTGTVIAVRGLIADVDDGERTWPCTLRRVLRTRSIDQNHPVTVGDRVRFRVEADTAGVVREGVIEWVAPRRGLLVRKVGQRDRVLVANVDQAVIVSSAAMPAPKPHLIDRYIVAALAGGMRPVICMNKLDLDEDGQIAAILGVYRSLGYPALSTCAIRGDGIDSLRELLSGNSSVLAGQSGVGKSSLLNAVQPGLGLQVGDVIEQTQKGRHTTTTARLLKLDVGGFVVDTPGVKSFDIGSVPLGEIEMYFEEFAERLADCKYPDCTHIHEPACAVLLAVQSGEIHESRYESYLRMFQERNA
jgi:ribosome biogenesis GTPase